MTNREEAAELERQKFIDTFMLNGLSKSKPQKPEPITLPKETLADLYAPQQTAAAQTSNNSKAAQPAKALPVQRS